jgi:hypothetical protein
VSDLPLSGRIVQLLLIARRFRCDAVLCGRQIFTERFAAGVLATSARRTARLASIVHHLGLALGGRPAAGFAKRLMLPVSKDTLLRVVRRRSRPPADPLRVIGIDDWAWRRNHRYANIICNLGDKLSQVGFQSRAVFPAIGSLSRFIVNSIFDDYRSRQLSTYV